MGTMQMMYAIGMSQYDDKLKKTLDKVDKALFMTPCFTSDSFAGTLTENRAMFE